MNPRTFRVHAAENLGGRGHLGDKRGNRRTGTILAYVAAGTREPNELAAGVHYEREGLWGSAKFERNGVSTIAVRGEWGSGDGGILGILEVVGS